MGIARESGYALLLGLASSVRRPRNLLLSAAGFLIAAITLLVLLSIPAGLDRLAGQTGRDTIVMVLDASAQSESISALSPETVQLISTLPGLAKDPSGNPLLAPQFVTSTKLQRVDGSNVDVLMRGVTPQFWNVIADSVHVVNGGKPSAGINAVIAGRSVATTQNGLHTGSSLPLRGMNWNVSGMFDANGAVWDSEIWTDFQALQSAFNAQGQVSSVWVQLASPDDSDSFLAAFKEDRRLNSARTMRQHDYYAEQIGFIAAFVRIAAAGIACVLGLGAILAITNALGMALQMRRGEIATLRALGFRSSRLAIALLFEVLTVGAASAMLAIFVGWMLLRGWSIDSSTGAYTISFQMDIPWRVMVWTLVYSLALGVLSAAWPITQTIRAPLVNALKAE